MRRSRRHAPGQSQHRVSDGREVQPRPGLPLRPGIARYRRSGERGHQHRDRQQDGVGYGNTAGEQPLYQTDQATGAVSAEESLQELLTHRSQEELTPSLKEAAEQDGGSPSLQWSSSTESSLHAHLEQTENLQPKREQMEENEGGRDECEADRYEKDKEGHQDRMSSSACLKGSMHSHGRRAGPIRMDVPPCAVSPPPPLSVDHNQPQAFSGPLRGYSLEPKPAQFSSTGYAPLSTGPRPECQACTQSCEEPVSDSSPEAFSVSCAQLSSESCAKPFRTILIEAHGDAHGGPFAGQHHKGSEEQQSFEKSLDVPSSQPMPQSGQHIEPRQQASVSSRLNKAGCPERCTAKYGNRTSSSDSFYQEAQELCDECPDAGPPSPGSHGGQALESSCAEAPPPSARVSGDAISLAIRDIKEAIEEVKTKAVRSPYTPDPPTEPVWVMREDVSLAEDCPLQGHPQTPPQGSAPHCMVSDMCAFTLKPTLHCKKQNVLSVAGPCDPEDLIDGIIFAASYLGSTQLLSERMPSKSGRMRQAQEATSRVRAAQKKAQTRHQGTEGEAPSSATEVDLFLSIQRIKVLNADTQEIMMDHPLRTISYIADIGNTVVLMARGKMIRSRSTQDQLGSADSHLPGPARDEHPQYRMVCNVFESEDAQLIAQSIGQAFSVAYQEFLRANGIDPDDLSQREYSDILSSQDMYNDDLIHFSKSENCRDVHIEKQKGEILGVVIVESGWGSILPTVIIASLMHSGPAAKSGRLNIGDQIMTVNSTSLVGLPLSTCQSIIKGLKSQSRIKMNIVRCPPVTMVLIRRPDLRYQLGFSVQNGIICSLMRGGIAERGGVRVGHRIIDINGQSVVATAHEKIVHILSNAVGEIHMKTMPGAMYRLLTAQEQPIYI
uniref:Amyloid beta (A4) precursor protein-binding, family A, member 1b n=1 Tax=Electrophorus electricus TaxID=8005 RepID=A0A4W4FJ82_ELEEL